MRAGPRALATGFVLACVLSACSTSRFEPTASVPTQDVVSSVTTDAALHRELPASVAARGSITVGTTLTPGVSGLPYGGTLHGRQVGLQADLRDAVAKVLGVRVTVRYGTFPTIVPGTQNGKYDVGMANFGVTKERQKVVAFATYLTDGQAFLGSKEVRLSTITKLTDLCGYTVATAPGSTFQQILEKGAGTCAAAGRNKYTIQYFTDPGPIFLGLANGKVDLYFGPTLSLKYDAKHIDGTKFLGQFSASPVGFVTARKSSLTKALSDAVNVLIADGVYRRILAKWDVPGSAITRSLVNPTAAL